MLWISLQSTTTTISSGTGSGAHSLFNYPRPNDVVVLVVAHGTGSATLSAFGATGGTMSTVTLVQLTNASRTLHVVLLYNFAGSITNFSFTSSVTGFATAHRHIATDRNWSGWTSTAHAESTVATGTSSAAETNTLTPAAGDLLIAALLLDSISADSSARVHTGNQYLFNVGSELSSPAGHRGESGFQGDALAVSSKEAWTLAASANWAAIQSAVTPPATLYVNPATIGRYKGRLTKVLDVAAEA